MQAHATTLFSLLFDVLPPVATEPPRNVQRKTVTCERRKPVIGETQLSMEKLHDRLGLLAQLQLPCSILITRPRLYLRETLIDSTEMVGDSLSIVGEGFNFCLRRPNIHAIRLSNHSKDGDGMSSLDIFHLHGMLYASIQPAAGGKGAEVWRDVMDNPMLALA